MKNPRVRVLGSKVHCWTSAIFFALYKNHPPVTYRRSSEIIKEVHTQMIDHLLKHGRPILIKQSIGYLELCKRKVENTGYTAINWPKTLAKGKWVKELNHHTSGYIWYIRLQFINRGDLKLFKLHILKQTKLKLAKLIFSGDVQ